MNVVDGKKIANDILEAVARQVTLLDKRPKLTVLACDPNFETQKYLALKQSKAKLLGVKVEVIILPADTDTQSFIKAIEKSVSESDGLIVQLPLPKSIDTDVILKAVPSSHDVDAFKYQTGDSFVLPPVVGAIDEISRINNLEWKNKNVVIFGAGRLVGIPARYYAESKQAIVSQVTETSQNIETLVANADIIILGVGQPNLLLPSMVKDGVVVFDAGASEDGGLLVGDASPGLANRASLFTPVPGGIGPITIAILFRNLLELSLRQ
jgi:methylenetetrahydrofolate dehydrogenase (NADP+)/methenyltetrahydrofolate cyclohydrolase